MNKFLIVLLAVVTFGYAVGDAISDGITVRNVTQLHHRILRLEKAVTKLEVNLNGRP